MNELFVLLKTFPSKFFTPSGSLEVRNFKSKGLGGNTLSPFKSLKSLIYITSDKCYENVEWIWGYRENDKLGGYDAYSSSKAAAENIFSAYLESFFKKKNLGAVSVRAGNVIGGGDWSENRIIPDIIKSIENKKK